MTPRRQQISGKVLAAALLTLVLHGCGGTQPGAEPTALSAADRACRAQWRDLVADWNPDLGVAVERAFRGRVDALAAAAVYHAGTATKADCGQTLTGHRAQVDALNAVLAKVRPFDLERRAQVATAKAAKWERGLSKRAKRALRTLRSQAPRADRDLAPALTQLAGAEPTDAAAVRTGMKDLALLAQASGTLVRCGRALAVLRRAGIRAD